MKKLITICLSLVLAGFVTTSLAQTVKVKREAMTPGRLSAIGKSSERPTTGLRVVGKGAKVFVSADTTGSGASTATSFTWSFVSKPAGSAATIDSSNKMMTSFTVDTTGQFIVQVAVNGGATSADTFFVSTFAGNPAAGLTCATCHPTNNTEWAATPHATIYKRGLMGQLEVNEFGKGAYAVSCAKCHTTGWNDAANNGNFGYLAKKAGWDTTWYKTYTLAGGDYEIPNGDSTAWNLLNSSYSSLLPVASIGCESCHGPGKDHNGDKTKIGKSLDAGVCLQCHDAPSHHNIGSYWKESLHASWPTGGHATSSGCFPCHSGSAFVKFVANKANPGYSSEDGGQDVSCAVCHDPHSDANPMQLRTVTVDSLRNGYKPNGIAGMGEICMNCHQARYSVASKVTTKAPYYGFSDRYGPHHGPQGDMLLGQNGYEYGLSFSGTATHTGLPDGCVTCHMGQRNGQPNHSMAMVDGLGNDITTACQSCHGNITSFDDIKAFADYDGNGVVEGVRTEVQGMLNLLKARLPKDDAGEPVTMMKDSLKIKDHPEFVKAIWNYYFVTEDKSMGIHNTKYTVALLQASLGSITGVKVANTEVPGNFELTQNYPNPFNPSTEIRFSVPRAANVNLSVYNLLGERIATLANGEVVPGTYTATWNGTNQTGMHVASGVYFYRLAVGSNGNTDYTMTKKMLLTK